MRDAGLIPLPLVAPAFLEKCLMYLIAALPKRASGSVDGELLADAYMRKLAHMSEAEVNYITDKAMERCKWFPTIAELLEIAAEWRRDDDLTRTFTKAKAMLSADRHQRYRAAMIGLRDRELTADQIAALPQSWIQVAVDGGYLAMVEGQVSYPTLIGAKP